MRSWQEVSEVKVIQEEVSASTWGKKKQAESSSLLQGVPLHSPPVAGLYPPLPAGLPSPSPRPQPPLLLPPLLLGWHDGGNLLFLLLRHVLVIVILKGDVLPVRWDTQRALLPTVGGIFSPCSSPASPQP